MKVPLFLTRYSLSTKNAIGVQTNYFLEPHREWLHFYWRSKEFFSREPRSVRLENLIFSRVSFFHQINDHVQRLQRLGAGWWKDDQLRPGYARMLFERYQPRVSTIYAAPLESRDAKRIRQIIEIFGVPFVLHLWDFLDARIDDNEDLRWLIQRAAKIFCLSQPMLDEITPVRPDADRLVFCRKPSRTVAGPGGDQTLRIVMIGDIYSYRHGLDLLDQAVQRLILRGAKITVCYLGREKSFRSLASSLTERLEPLGFVQGDENRDRELSKCHIGFLPGPYTDPNVDMRSRYSIPSRILDFLATGLPIVGTIQPKSATGIFCEKLGIQEHCFCRSAADVENSLIELLDQSNWLSAAAKSRQAFDLLARESQPERLKQAMQALAGC